MMLWLGHHQETEASDHAASHRVKLLFFMSYLHRHVDFNNIRL